ncbi:peptidyl-dipeptidase Dcp [Asanoa ferruginea]|uniref:Peptidyl-dipeptidase Dcp n=1 Tax=Asanoa ferruginea TaxID=53367 RepID=A0A3D9ZNY2_9ACTN|nr:M3 family metallopeptidase [Asanoa ferruginea]REF98897.1 peptidyl-dipeptidase Dcp [Asanoa ferruginea]GIF46421.1 peptidyl-dipeptidase Dcp [Asanoa ferruginea]
MTTAVTAPAGANPLVADFDLPPFADIRPEHYRDALARGLAEAEAELAAIVADPRPPTFATVIVPLERCGELAERVMVTFQTVVGAQGTAELIQLEAELAPRWAAYRVAKETDPRLFARIAAVGTAGLNAEERYLVRRYVDRMTRAGVGLAPDRRARLAEIAERLAALSAEFNKRVQADTDDLALVVEARQLDGLGPGDVAAAGHAAQRRGLPGKHLIPLSYPTGHPHLRRLRDREVRRRLLAASMSRGRRGNANDTREVLLEITRLRAEQAELLGHPSYGAMVTAGEMAGDPDTVAALLGPMARAAAVRARAEHAELQVQSAEPVEASDWPYYAEQVRAHRYDIDGEALRPYFELDNVLTRGVFHAARLSYGLTFAERPDLPGFHPDCRVFEVRDADGAVLGTYLFDPYAREGKRGGARSHSIVPQSRLTGRKAVVCNSFAIPAAAPGKPTLLTVEQVVTLFHEFGHALHALLSDVTYPSISGMNVFRDFIEYPAQVNEMWATRPEIVANYAVHVETGEPLPQRTIDRISAAATFQQGYLTCEHLAAALVDQAWHGLGADHDVVDVDGFERGVLAAHGLDHPAIPARYSSTYFMHVFFGDYGGRYYSYVWSEIFAADTIAWFEERSDDPRGAGETFRRAVLAVGGGADPRAVYRAFRGRDASAEALLNRRGLR